jgi:SAM-dependent methyltransferase
MYNQAWVKKRLDAIITFYGANFFLKKKILDVGSGYGEIASALAGLGASVTCVDARHAHITKIRAQNHTIRGVVADLEREWPFAGEYFDLILHLSTLDHMNNIDQHLENILISSNYLVLDTQVCDSLDPAKIPLVKESKLNVLHSYSGVGCRPSVGYIEEQFNKNGLVYERVDDMNCNSKGFVYDWFPKNNGMIRDGLSRMWFAKRHSLMNLETIPGKHSHPIVFDRPKFIHPHHVLQEHVLPTVLPTPVPAAKPIDASLPATEVPTPSAGPEQIQPIRSFVAPKQRIRLFYNYYVDKNPTRRHEIDQCIQKHIDSQNYELVVVESEKNPTFSLFFEKINLIVAPDDISIICYADIFFDNSITLTKNIPHQSVYSLSRWDWHQNRTEFIAPNNKHDTWIVRGHVKNVDGDFKIGKPNSSGRIAYEFDKAGYSVTNPCSSIKTFHYHDSGIRTYTKEETIEGPILIVNPCNL